MCSTYTFNNVLHRSAQVNVFNTGSTPLIVDGQAVEPGSSRVAFFQAWRSQAPSDDPLVVMDKRIVVDGQAVGVFDATAVMRIGVEGCSISLKAMSFEVPHPRCRCRKVPSRAQ